jgi:hypothetical protein
LASALVKALRAELLLRVAAAATPEVVDDPLLPEVDEIIDVAGVTGAATVPFAVAADVMGVAVVPVVVAAVTVPPGALVVAVPGGVWPEVAT